MGTRSTPSGPSTQPPSARSPGRGVIVTPPHQGLPFQVPGRRRRRRREHAAGLPAGRGLAGTGRSGADRGGMLRRCGSRRFRCRCRPPSAARYPRDCLPLSSSGRTVSPESGQGNWSVMEVRYDPDAQDLPFTAPPSYGGMSSSCWTSSCPSPGSTAHGSSPDGQVPTIVLVSQQSERLSELLASGAGSSRP